MRLEMIMKLIQEEEVEEIDDHIEVLQELHFNEDLDEIITLLRFGLYEKAKQAIKLFMGRQLHDAMEFSFIKIYKR